MKHTSRSEEDNAKTMKPSQTVYDDVFELTISIITSVLGGVFFLISDSYIGATFFLIVTLLSIINYSRLIKGYHQRWEIKL